jgi:hypothetical protein
VTGREGLPGVVVIVERECQLFDAVLAIEPRRGVAHILHRREEQTHQD